MQAAFSCPLSLNFILTLVNNKLDALEINKYIEKKSASSWMLTRIIQRCKVKEI
jgi:hypothetical protein